jgi:Leucine-rich repeat (LRR) protein
MPPCGGMTRSHSFLPIGDLGVTHMASSSHTIWFVGIVTGALDLSVTQKSTVPKNQIVYPESNIGTTHIEFLDADRTLNLSGSQNSTVPKKHIMYPESNIGPTHIVYPESHIGATHIVYPDADRILNLSGTQKATVPRSPKIQ